MESKLPNSPMDDKIRSIPCWTAEDRVQALFAVSANNLNYDAGYEQLKVKRKPRRKHKMKWMKKPMAVSEVLLELQETDFRENALRALSSYLMQRLEDDVERYRMVGFYIFNSFGTMAILLQEVELAYARILSGDLSVRESKRLLNVLTLLQCIAANEEIRGDLLEALIPNYVVPLIFLNETKEIYETVRMVALSVVGIICQAREHQAIKWALQTDMVSACLFSVQIGSELSKVVTLLAAEQEFSPRLLFHVIRCYILLTQNPRALEMLKRIFPSELQNHTFQELIKEFPTLANLLHQLLLIVGKTELLEPQLGQLSGAVNAANWLGHKCLLLENHDGMGAPLEPLI